MQTILETQGLSKKYGRIDALQNLSISIPKGSVYGLLGPNGSGKSTFLGIVLGVVNASSGNYKWFDGGIEHELRKNIGAILEKPNFYPYMSAYDNLQIVAQIKLIQNADSRINETLTLVGLIKRKDDKFKTYSLGMKQRLAIASALLTDPEVLLLDEPTNGLDPQGIAEIRQLIIEVAQSGKTIILASHLLDEVQKVCTAFAVLRNGVCIHQGNVDEDFKEEIQIEIATNNDLQLMVIIANYPGYKNAVRQKETILLSFDALVKPIEINTFLFENEIKVKHFVEKKKNLEQQFLEILKVNGTTA